MSDPLRLRQWRAYGNIVEIAHTRALIADDQERERVGAAVHAYATALAGSADVQNDHTRRIVAALDAYPQGYTTTADLAAHLLVRVRADDLRMLLGDLHAYRVTFQRIMEDEAKAPLPPSNRSV